MTPEQLKAYEDYNIKKYHQIAMAAIVAEANIQKSKQTANPAERERLLNLAISDLREIHLNYSKDDYPGPVRVEEEK